MSGEYITLALDSNGQYRIIKVDDRDRELDDRGNCSSMTEAVKLARQWADDEELELKP